MAESERRPTAFKDYFDRAAARALGKQVAAVEPSFDVAAFVRKATRGLLELEFADRVRNFSEALAAQLPGGPESLQVLTRSLPEPLPNADSVTDGFLQWPIGQYIADHGVDHFAASMQAMIELTQRFSAEFAVRPFVERYPDRTFARLLALTDHDSVHVRRWCSEGTRPRLPWGKKLRDLVEDPSPIWPILEALEDDPELYVRRSVANNLNDIAKDHPDLVIARCKKWSLESNPQRDAMIAHALRSLIKAGNPGALAVVGYGPATKLDADLRVDPRRVALGGNIVLEATLTNRARTTQRVLVDFAVHYVRKKGDATAKVFKWTKRELAPGESIELTKTVAMRTTTTRALYPGKHRVELQVNGSRVAKASFSLVEA